MCARVKCVLCMLCCVLLSETVPVPHVCVTSVPCTCRACHCAVHVLCVRCVCDLICRHATCIYHAWVMCHDRAVPFVRCRSYTAPLVLLTCLPSLCQARCHACHGVPVPWRCRILLRYGGGAGDRFPHHAAVAAAKFSIASTEQ